jgi:hypothetical protein
MARTPEAVRRNVLENSLLARGWAESLGTYMTGMMTYLYCLGPDNLGNGYAGPIDRKMAAGIMALSFRLRLRDVARLLADALLPAPPGRPVHLLNIAGGPAADSLNALLLVRRECPEWFQGRTVRIHVLELDAAGPAFGARALDALRAGPLAACRITFERVPYDWADPSGLPRLCAAFEPEAVLAGSSEGGLFDYGSDAEIVANLRSLPANLTMTGSVVRDEATLDPRLASTIRLGPRPLIRYLGLEAFKSLAGQAGWSVRRTIDSVAHHAVALKR